MQQEHPQGTAMDQQMMGHHYKMLGFNLVVSVIIMYLVMFAIIWSAGDFLNNLNMFYMTLMMAMPMGILMILMMRMMYRNKRLNIALCMAFTLVFLLSFWAIRGQVVIGDRQFVRSMIPHHSGAILMCQRASIRDREVRQLCFEPNGIVESQKREIAQMRTILGRM